MKKALLAICSALPGGATLAVMMILFAGCARLQYQTVGARVSGYTLNPEAAMVMSAEAEEQSSRAYALRRCADEPRNCRAAEISQLGPWGAGEVETPGAGYKWVSIRAAGVGSSTANGNTTESGDVRKDIARIEKKLNAVDKGQDAFFRALKKGKRK